MSARIKPSGSTQAERDAISLGRIESLIDNVIDTAVECPTCKKKHEIKVLDNSVVTAMRMRYDKLRPSLSATELTSINPDERLSEDQILGKLSALLDQYPDLLQRALAVKAKLSPLGAVAAIPTSPIDGEQAAKSD